MMSRYIFRWIFGFSGWALLVLPYGGEAANHDTFRRLTQNYSTSAITTSRAYCAALNELKFQRQVLITFKGRPGKVSNVGLAHLQSSLIRGYNRVATCGNVGGTLLRLTIVNIDRNQVDSYGAMIRPTASNNVTQQFTVMATVQGSCRGCDAASFRLLNYKQPPQKQRRELRQSPRGSTSGNSFENRNLVTASSSKSGDKNPKQIIPIVCKCPLPTKQSFLNSFNKLASVPSGIDSIVDIGEMDSYTPCSPTSKSFETILTLDFAGVQNLTNVADLQSQYLMIEQAALETYNELNALNTNGVCDPTFLTLSDANIIVAPGYGATPSSSPRLANFNGDFTFNVTGTCRGCQGDPPPLFDDGTQSRRKLNARTSKQEPPHQGKYQPMETHNDEDDSVKRFSGRHRRLPMIAGGCYCPANTTQFRRPTEDEFLQAFNARLGLLGSQGADLITIVDSVQDAAQNRLVNCTADVNYFQDVVAIDYAGSIENSTTHITSNEANELGDAFAKSYNSLTQQFCDPLFRTIESVQLLKLVDGRRLTNKQMPLHDNPRRELIKYNRTIVNRTSSVNKISLTFYVRGRCRGCSQTTPLYNDGISRRVLAAPAPKARAMPLSVSSLSTLQQQFKKQSPRQLQQQASGQTDQCFCYINPAGDRAPTFDEFLTAYNQTVTSTNISLAVVGGKDAITLPPSSSPSHAPSTSRPTRSSTRKPHTAPPTPRQTAAALSEPPTILPSRRPTVKPTRSPRSHPKKQPTVQPTNSPSRGPTTQPTSFPSLSPVEISTLSPSARPVIPATLTPSSKPPTNTPTKKPSMQPTLQPSLQPTPPPSPQPTPPPSPQPTPPPSLQPTPPPSLQPRPPPSLQPTPPPSPQPTPSPSPRQSRQPTVSPTQAPSLPPTPPPSFAPTPAPVANTLPPVNPTPRPIVSSPQPTSRPTPMPTSPPTARPTLKPTTAPSSKPTSFPTKQPTTNPTKRPTPPPTASPTPRPTPSPTRKLTLAPTRKPTVSPTPRPTSPPTASPTPRPTPSPTRKLTVAPTRKPTASPTPRPTSPPTASPTPRPTPSPTRKLTVAPTRKPTASPTQRPTPSPTRKPTASPTGKPTAPPTKKPTASPTGKPTAPPTRKPTASPTGNPTASPTKKPTPSPSTTPTASPTTPPTPTPTSSPTPNPTLPPTLTPTLAPTQSTRNPTQPPTPLPISLSPSSKPSRQPFRYL